MIKFKMFPEFLFFKMYLQYATYELVITACQKLSWNHAFTCYVYVHSIMIMLIALDYCASGGLIKICPHC